LQCTSRTMLDHHRAGKKHQKKSRNKWVKWSNREGISLSLC
jgi:hypothetical protein